ncbi:peptidase inhibitor family I36 protein [Streptomyces sp. NPDC048603]|uniref:peptidase inhibitor family I36 protein n=1 Tax=Streptomyces sp. NPDC048603 TaxID=3365577 RepID=UPI003721D491
MRSARIAAAAVAVAGTMLITAPSASAATPAPVAQPTTKTLSPAAERAMQDRIAKSKPVVGTYKGKRINLSQDWQGAKVCAETSKGEVKCFDNQREADKALAAENTALAKRAAGRAGSGRIAMPAASEDCGSGWVCIWEHNNYSGRRLQWSAKGTKNLADWGFRDKASSGCVSRLVGGANLVDFRTGQPDPEMFMGVGSCYDFTRAGYVYGGSWNDKADAIHLW